MRKFAENLILGKRVSYPLFNCLELVAPSNTHEKTNKKTKKHRAYMNKLTTKQANANANLMGNLWCKK